MVRLAAQRQELRERVAVVEPRAKGKLPKT